MNENSLDEMYNVNYNTLLALSKILGKDDRYKSICIEFTKSSAVYVATNGVILLTVHEETDYESDEIILFPVSMIKDIEKLKLKTPFITIKNNSDNIWNVEISDTTGKLINLSFEKNNLEFPTNWRRIIPSEVTYEPAQFDSNLLNIVNKAVSILLNRPAKTPGLFTIYHNGPKGAAPFTTTNKSIFGAIMPLRVNQEDYSKPSFLDE